MERDWRRRSGLRLGMLSTYPPTQCGLATFSAALTRALTASGHDVDVVRVDDGTLAVAPQVEGVLKPGSPGSIRRAALTLSNSDAAIIQHEYGIFGGDDGDEVLDVIAQIAAPVVVVLHTVPMNASPHQAEILVELCARADLVVVMSESARERLLARYSPIDESKLRTIQHGARLAAHLTDERRGHTTRPDEVLTWGLLGPGKGIEHVIDAIGMLWRLGYAVPYTIAGATHPKVLAREGNAYRDRLIDQAKGLGIRHLVSFDQQYRGVAELTEYIASFGAVVMPYDTTEQVTSGVLVDSLAAGRAVIATEFPHAVELLSSGAGMVVPHRDPRAIAVALHTVLREPGTRSRMMSEACALAPELSWDAVALEYAGEIDGLLRHRDKALA